jgi:hypothetical protein
VFAGNYLNPRDLAYLMPGDTIFSFDQSSAEVIVPSGTASDLFVRLSAAPGPGDSVTITIYQNASNTALACTVSNINTTCSNTEADIAFADGDGLSILYDETNREYLRVKVAFRYGAD